MVGRAAQGSPSALREIIVLDLPISIFGGG
jgi:hypothetical protein